MSKRGEPKNELEVINAICEHFIAIVCSVEDCTFARVVPRYEGDPKSATSMRQRCPKHDEGDFDEPVYYDFDGNEVWADNPEEG